MSKSIETIKELLTPEMRKKVDEHEKICNYIHNLYVTKNWDYGDSMHPLYEEYGLTAFMVMFSIKLNRIKSLMEKQSSTYESLEDSLLDLANYAMIAVTELRLDTKDNNIENIEVDFGDDKQPTKMKQILLETHPNMTKVPTIYTDEQ